MPTADTEIDIQGQVSSDTAHFRTQFTGEQEWYTPEKYIEAARRVLGVIDLDPASSLLSQKVVQARYFYTSYTNGLQKKWYGKVWMNPPYTQPLISQFIYKLLREISYGDVCEAILLTHNYTDTTWFHKAQNSAQKICFTRGRIRFLDQYGKEAAPTQGQAFFYFGSNEQLFIKVFRQFGFIR